MLIFNGGLKIYDVIVIGTGAGGATVAKDLCFKERKVLILEKGSYQKEGSYVAHMKTKKIHLKIIYQIKIKKNMNF